MAHRKYKPNKLAKRGVDYLTKQNNLRLLLTRVGLGNLLNRGRHFFQQLIKDPLSLVKRLIQSLIYCTSLEIDYLGFKLHNGSIFHMGREFSNPNKKLLLLSFSNYVTQIKGEAFLAKVLQLNGFSPVIVTNSSYRRAIKYYKIFGFDQFEFFDKYLYKKNYSPQAIEEVEIFFSRPITVQDIKNYKFKGTKLGAHMLRTYTRNSFKGSIDISNPDTIHELKNIMLQGILNVEQAEILLNKINPEVIFSHHPANLGEGDIFEVGLQRGINSIYWDNAQRIDHWLFKRYSKNKRDMQLFSLSDETWDIAQNMDWGKKQEMTLQREIEGRYHVESGMDARRLQEGKQLKTKEDVQQQLNLNLTKKTAVVFSHIVWDSSFLFGKDLFSTYEEWLVETTRAACNNAAVNWIIKLHPANLIKLRGNKVQDEPSEITTIRNAIGTLPEHVKILHSDTDINTFSLFEITDYCLTVRGTIGIEMPCFGIPVFTAGTGRYSGRGFTVDSDSQTDYLDKLNHIQDYPRLNPEQILLAKKHAYWLLTMRPVKFDMVNKIVRKNISKNSAHPLASNLSFKINSINDIISNPCVNSFSHWVADESNPDFYACFSDIL